MRTMIAAFLITLCDYFNEKSSDPVKEGGPGWYFFLSVIAVGLILSFAQDIKSLFF